MVILIVAGCGGGGSKPATKLAGARVFAEVGCLNCHTYGRAGSRSLAAPDLTREGLRRRGVKWQIRHLRCPACLTSGSPMPSFAALGYGRLKQLATFLEASRGPK